MAKKFNKYEVIVENGNNVSKVYTVAASKKELASQIEKGGSEIVRVKEIPDYLSSASKVRNDLKATGYGEIECSIIYNMLLHLEGTEV